MLQERRDVIRAIPRTANCFVKLTPKSRCSFKVLQKNIRNFSSNLAATLIKHANATVRQRLPGIFKIQGVMYRKLDPLLYCKNKPPKCLQVCFFDSQEQANMQAERFAFNVEVTEEIRNRNTSLFHMLHQMLLNALNLYLQSFFSIKEHIEANNLNPAETFFEIHGMDRPTPSNQHPGRFNLPTVLEISMLMSIATPRDAKKTIVCNVRSATRSNELKFLQHHHRAHNPLQHPLLFSSGTDGWHHKMISLNSARNKVTAL